MRDCLGFTCDTTECTKLDCPKHCRRCVLNKDCINSNDKSKVKPKVKYNADELHAARPTYAELTAARDVLREHNTAWTNEPTAEGRDNDAVPNQETF